MYLTAKLITCCIRSGIPCVLENPVASMLFRAPPIARILAHPKCLSVILDKCGYSARWRKRTRFACWICGDPSSLRKICSGHSGICFFSNRHHIVLKGTSPGGPLWTSIAQECPKRLSYALADFLINAFDSRFQQKNKSNLRLIIEPSVIDNYGKRLNIYFHSYPARAGCSSFRVTAVTLHTNILHLGFG